MTDKFLALLSFMVLFAFLAVLVGFLREADLTIIVLGVLAAAAYDFYFQLLRKR
jgi:hypothetical protein